MKNLIKTFEIKNEKTKNSLQEIISSLLVGSLLFFSIYGFRVFNIFPVILNDNDYLLYQSSYFAFINSEWSFPLFSSDKFYENFSVNLFLADYIPLYSLFLKLIYSLLNIKILNPFIFWFYISTILMYYFSFKIFSLSDKFTFIKKHLAALLVTSLPLMPFKYLYHSGEGAHFMLLIGIYFYFMSKKNIKYLNYFSFLAALSLWIHFYIFTMISGILFISILRSRFTQPTVFNSLAIYFVTSLFIFFLTFGSIDAFLFSLSNNIASSFNPRWSSEFNSFL